MGNMIPLIIISKLILDRENIIDLVELNGLSYTNPFITTDFNYGIHEVGF